MKSKASLFLMEQLVMVLIFALAAVLCLGIFVRANKISSETARRDKAVIIAQNAAQMLKKTGDPELTQQRVDSGEFMLEIQKENSEFPGLCQAKIIVFYESQEVFSLRTGWQEVGQ